VAAPNPYRYDLRDLDPGVEVPRDALITQAADTLRGGGIAYLLGGRGMGKSVFLRQLERHLRGQPGAHVVLITGPAETLERTLQKLARKLALATDPGYLDVEEILDRYLASSPNETLILLFDELDRYAATGQAQGRGLFNALETARQDARGRLGLFAAGGLGFFLLKDQLGSNFLSRADRLVLTPFKDPELRRLAQPFAQRHRPLSQDVLDALRVQTGGNPLLSTYALRELWVAPEPDPALLADILGGFKERKPDFIPEFWKSITDGEPSDVPRALLRRIQQDGRLTSAARDEILGKAGERITLRDALDLLRAAGLVELDGPLEDDPIRVHPVASILNLLPGAVRSSDLLGERLVRDLRHLLARLHAMAPDFYRPGDGRGDKRLLPETSFSAFLALGLTLLGWQVEREAQHGAGRTDLKLRRPGADEVALVEVKIWGRNDYAAAQQQVESYWASAEVRAAAVVMIADRPPPAWPTLYKERCLPDRSVTVRAEDAPVAQIAAQGRSPAGFDTAVDHLLLPLPRGR
jgi:hypothetical protein